MENSEDKFISMSAVRNTAEAEGILDNESLKNFHKNAQYNTMETVKGNENTEGAENESVITEEQEEEENENDRQREEDNKGRTYKALQEDLTRYLNNIASDIEGLSVPEEDSAYTSATSLCIHDANSLADDHENIVHSTNFMTEYSQGMDKFKSQVTELKLLCSPELDTNEIEFSQREVNPLVSSSLEETNNQDTEIMIDDEQPRTKTSCTR
ncbi:hypothetical protein SK128_020683, partial [Halocaridina rubra]